MSAQDVRLKVVNHVVPVGRLDYFLYRFNVRTSISGATHVIQTEVANVGDIDFRGGDIMLELRIPYLLIQMVAQTATAHVPPLRPGAQHIRSNPHSQCVVLEAGKYITEAPTASRQFFSTMREGGRKMVYQSSMYRAGEISRSG